MLVLSIILPACVPQEPIAEEDFEIMGLAPVYADPEGLELKSEPSRAFGNLGKIVSVGNFIFINERFQGVHVVDNSDPINPVRSAFWSIPGNIDFTLKDNFLYAENGWDLLTINVSDHDNIALVSTVENIYQRPQSDRLFPPNYFGAFECADPELGTVIGWEEKLLTDPKCWR